MSLVLLKLVNGMEVVGDETSVPQGYSYDLVALTSVFIVVTQPVAPDKIQLGLAPLSVAAVDPSKALCTIPVIQIIAQLDPSEALQAAHREATGKVALARAPVIALR